MNRWLILALYLGVALAICLLVPGLIKLAPVFGLGGRVLWAGVRRR